MRSNTDKPGSGNGWAAIATWVVPRTGMSQTAVAARRSSIIQVRRGISPLNADRRLRRACRSTDRDYWTKALREAERELEAATTRSAVNTAAKKLPRAKAELKALEDVLAERPKRESTRGRGTGGASSEPARLRRSQILTVPDAPRPSATRVRASSLTSRPRS